MRPKACSNPHGLTLIEVVAAVALLGSVLVASVMAHSALRRREADASWRLDAIQQLDAFLTDRLHPDFDWSEQTGGGLGDSLVWSAERRPLAIGGLETSLLTLSVRPADSHARVEPVTVTLLIREAEESPAP